MASQAVSNPDAEAISVTFDLIGINKAIRNVGNEDAPEARRWYNTLVDDITDYLSLEPKGPRQAVVARARVVALRRGRHDGSELNQRYALRLVRLLCAQARR